MWVVSRKGYIPCCTLFREFSFLHWCKNNHILNPQHQEQFQDPAATCQPRVRDFGGSTHPSIGLCARELHRIFVESCIGSVRDLWSVFRLFHFRFFHPKDMLHFFYYWRISFQLNLDAPFFPTTAIFCALLFRRSNSTHNAYIWPINYTEMTRCRNYSKKIAISKKKDLHT